VDDAALHPFHVVVIGIHEVHAGQHQGPVSEALGLVLAAAVTLVGHALQRLQEQVEVQALGRLLLMEELAQAVPGFELGEELEAALAGLGLWDGRAQTLAIGVSEIVDETMAWEAAQKMLTEAELFIRCGVYKLVLPYSKIQRLELSCSLWNAPALSVNRVKIVHDGGFCLVSPKNRSEFIADLQARLPVSRARA